MNCVLHFMVNFGFMTNWKKYHQFPFQNCTDKRVIMWNEPNFEDGVEETLKLLFGEDQMNARIKYEGDAIIQRTSILLSTDTDSIGY